jgi:hypothetical protein
VDGGRTPGFPRLSAGSIVVHRFPPEQAADEAIARIKQILSDE